jgi:2-hydroxy-6-oxonona-2,4-dienedioate hydrolase
MTIWTDLEGLAFKQAYYNAGGVRTRVMEAGSGEPLIFLHGAGGHAEAFARNLGEHAKHFHVICADMLGHGHTDAPDVAYNIETLVGHLGDLIDALGYKTVSLSGVSLGGMVSAHFAMRYPERVKRLALVTSMLMLRDTGGKREMDDALQRSRKATGAPTRESVRSRLAWLMHDPDKSVTEELVDVRYRIYCKPAHGKAMRAVADEVVAGLLDDDWARKWSNQETLTALRCPTLLVWSRHNPGLSAERAAQGMKYIADARMVIFENSAHWPQWEEPERFNEEHIAFMRGNSA